MRTFTLILILTASPAFSSEPTDFREPIDFRNDLIPVFTKSGCNSGACHGSAIGRGGFKLSLYGSDPQADFEAVVRDVGGRRVNLAQPEKSLLFQKPAEYIAHGGGTVIDDEGEAAELILGWIRQGTSQPNSQELTRVTVSPRQSVLALEESVPIQTIAHYSDGSQRDVTRWTVLTPEDNSSVEVESNDQGTHAKVLRRGRHVLVARYLTEVIPIELIVPLSDDEPILDEPSQNFIDDEIQVALQRIGLEPSPLINDAEFLRRLTLDLTGRLPTRAQVERVLDDHRGVAEENRLSLRRETVNTLLESEEFNEYWTLQFAKLLRIRPSGEDEAGMEKYHEWLMQQLRDQVGYDQLVRNLVLASGDSHEIGPANFYRSSKGPGEQAEFFSELLMGSRLRCANCHNHPLDRWTQDDYHGLAAIFAKVERGRIVSEDPKGIVIHPRTHEPARARIPGESFLADDEDLRLRLADWLTAKENPYFAKAIVNRLWKQMLGRGLVEPVDDFRATNPATHPALLNRLAEDFVAHDYDVRHTLRMIVMSNTYRRSSNSTEQNREDDAFYSHARKRALEPEVLADAISHVLGVPSQYGDQPLGTRAVSLGQSENGVRYLGCFRPLRSRGILRGYGNQWGRRTAAEVTLV